MQRTRSMRPVTSAGSVPHAAPGSPEVRRAAKITPFWQPGSQAGPCRPTATSFTRFRRHVAAPTRDRRDPGLAARVVDLPPLCQKNPAPTLTVSARMVVLKKKANTQCRVVILRMFLDVTLTSAVAAAVPMMNE